MRNQNDLSRVAAAFFLTAAAAFILTSCAARPPRKSLADDQAKSPLDANTAAAPAPDMTEASLRGSEFTDVEGVNPIYFEYDSAALKGTALETLKANAQYLKDHPNIEALVAGYCDERGTVEYNLALGQKRAKEVREYYIRLGVSAKSLATISYGKEKPFCAESNETCWASNRRAETRVRNATAANTPKSNTTAQ